MVCQEWSGLENRIQNGPTLVVRSGYVVGSVSHQGYIDLMLPQLTNHVASTSNNKQNDVTNTTYSVGDGGLTQKNFTDALKTKLDGIAAGANKYSLPIAGAETLDKSGTRLQMQHPKNRQFKKRAGQFC